MKSEDNNSPEIVHDFQNGYLALPFNQNQFKDFVKSLLGTPQTITKRIRGNFEVNLKDLQNFNDLIHQRITQQNHGRLVQLKTQIYYSDESSVTLSSYEELVTYNEVKPIISVAARMTWVYLIQFPDKDIPEKQEIEIMTMATPQGNIVEVDDLPVFFPSYGQFKIIIKHTARSWGADMEGLITNQINSILTPSVKWKEFLRKNSTAIGLLTGILFLLSSLVSIYFSTRNFNADEIKKVAVFVGKTNNIGTKTDYLTKYVAENAQNLYFLKGQLFIVVSVFFAIVLGIWVGTLADNRERSYLILTREAKKNKDEFEAKSKRKTVWFGISLAISIITGVISSYIFEWLTKA